MKPIFGTSGTPRLSRLTAVLLCACATVFAASAARADDSSDAKPPSDSTAPAPAPAGSDSSAPAAQTPPPAAAPAPDSGAAAPAATPAPAAPASYGTDPLTGAPLGTSGDRQFAHAITHPGSSLGGRFEIAITMPVQINSKFTETVGNGLELQYHLADPIGLVLGGTYFWQSYPTEFTDTELLVKAGQAPTTSEDISPQWEGHFALEFQPIYAKMAFFSFATLRFGFYVDAGVAVAGTLIELQPPSTGVQRTTGDTGIKPGGFFSTGFRFYIGDHFAIRLEVRDLMFSAYANSIRGCDQNDLNNIGNGAPQMASAACQSAFNNSTGKTDAHIAANLLTDTSTELINDFQFAAAISVVF